MPNEIKYDFSYLNSAIDKIKTLKAELPIKKGKSYEWDYLYSGLSKGSTIDSLFDFYSLTAERSQQIEILLDNVLMLLKSAKKQMQEKDDNIAEGYNK